MDPVTLLTLGAALVVVVAVVIALLVVLGHRAAGRRRLEEELDASRAELAAVHERLDALARQVGPAAEAGASPEFVITSLPGQSPVPASDASPTLTGRDVATVALTESVVRLAALTHGVRRALSPANRNRIRFEMGREVKRARRQRRRDLKDARRHLRNHPDLLSRDRSEDAA